MKIALIVFLSCALLSCLCAQDTFSLTLNGKVYGPFEFKNGNILPVGGKDFTLTIHKPEVSAKAERHWGNVIQIIDAENMLVSEYHNTGNIVYALEIDTSKYADGDRLQIMAEPIGTIQYQTPIRTTATVRKYKFVSVYVEPKKTQIQPTQDFIQPKPLIKHK